MSRIEYRLVSVTDDAIYVLDSTKTSGGGKPKALLGTMPRHSQLGPVSGRWAQVNWMAEPDLDCTEGRRATRGRARCWPDKYELSENHLFVVEPYRTGDPDQYCRVLGVRPLATLGLIGRDARTTMEPRDGGANSDEQAGPVLLDRPSLAKVEWGG
jgi:hypothetical protein